MNTDWDFPTLACLWEYRNGAIMAGADKLEALGEQDRERSLRALAERTATLARGLGDGWLVVTAFYMADDIYKSFFRFTGFSQGVIDYLAATAGEVVRELEHRGLVLHYVVDATQGQANLETMLEYLPAMLQASGFGVVGPQLAARELVRVAEGDDGVSIPAMQACRDEGHMIADQVIAEWHRERRSSAYLNIDLDDDSPALPMDVALAVCREPGTIVVFRDLAPAEGSEVRLFPPPDVTLPPPVTLSPRPVRGAASRMGQ